MIRVKVVPKSRERWLFWIMDDNTLKIRLKSLPEKWKANLELIWYISEELCIKKDKIKIVAWAGEQIKIIQVDFS